MRVIATDVGYDNVVVREVGEEFDMPEGSKAPWFKPVASQKPGNQKPANQNENLA